MLTLRTSAQFTVVRQIANHLDTDTNYVRAVIRNAYTDAIIDTLDLTDRGSQRFSKNWRVPPDPSGEGFYISIVTSVYSDSGYTTKNENYGDEETTYLVADQTRPGGGVNIGVGGLDSRTVRRIFQEEFAKISEKDEEEPEEEDEEEEVDLSPVLDAINSATKELKTALKPIKPEKVDFRPLNEALQSILRAVEEKEVTEPTDISPILDKLSDSDEGNDLSRREVMDLISRNSDALNKVIAGLPDIIARLLGETTFKIAATTATMEAPKKKVEEPVPFDISKLSS